jgi:class 3 adenylate cyclase
MGRVGDRSLPRGTVTFLFSDIEESTGLLRRVGNEAFAAMRADHRRLLRAAFDAHGGREIDTAGDGFFVAFDSARNAAEAAVKGQLTLARFRWPSEGEVRVRIGLHTAEPHVSEDGYVGVGVHRAARICDAAQGGQILLSNATAGIIEDAELPGITLIDLGEHMLKGLPRKQRLFQLDAPELPSEFTGPRTLHADIQRPGAGTFFHTDLTGWRHVIRVLGDDASSALVADYQAIVNAAVEASEGATLERAGDHMLAVFGEASNAVRAADAVRERLSEFAWPTDCDVAVAIVVHSGRWSGDTRRPAAATALLWITKLAKVVEPGQVLVSQATASLLEGDLVARRLRSLGERAVPDFDEPVHLHELTAP